MSNIYELLDQGQTLISDGAMGTMLQDAGLTDGGAPELWNVEHPDKVAEILDQYAKSGANLLTTNTFGGTKPRLQMHQLEERVFELNKAAAELAKKVASKYPICFVMGDIGPSGELMEPMGTLTIDSAKEIFAEQIKGLVAGGVDGILIETMSDLSEVEAAVKAAQEVAPGLPIAATFSFDTNLRTMMGVKPEMAVKTISALGVRLIGANCGRGTDEMKIIAQELTNARQPGTFIMTQSNAGLPKLVGDEFIYDGTPEEMAKYAQEMKSFGVNVIGSCCGSTPLHTKAISDAVK
jgi:5-methyltetrahydrofolate--homocysteine methyltransferase